MVLQALRRENRAAPVGEEGGPGADQGGGQLFCFVMRRMSCFRDCPASLRTMRVDDSLLLTVEGGER